MRLFMLQFTDLILHLAGLYFWFDAKQNFLFIFAAHWIKTKCQSEKKQLITWENIATGQKARILSDISREKNWERLFHTV